MKTLHEAFKEAAQEEFYGLSETLILEPLTQVVAKILDWEISGLYSYNRFYFYNTEDGEYTLNELATKAGYIVEEGTDLDECFYDWAKKWAAPEDIRSKAGLPGESYTIVEDMGQGGYLYYRPRLQLHDYLQPSVTNSKVVMEPLFGGVFFVPNLRFLVPGPPTKV